MIGKVVTIHAQYGAKLTVKSALFAIRKLGSFRMRLFVVCGYGDDPFIF